MFGLIPRFAQEPGNIDPVSRNLFLRPRITSRSHDRRGRVSSLDNAIEREMTSEGASTFRGALWDGESSRGISSPFKLGECRRRLKTRFTMFDRRLGGGLGGAVGQIAQGPGACWQLCGSAGCLYCGFPLILCGRHSVQKFCGDLALLWSGTPNVRA